MSKFIWDASSKKINHTKFPKVAQVVKNNEIWSPFPSGLYYKSFMIINYASVCSIMIIIYDPN
jgi:hypothetical protein